MLVYVIVFALWLLFIVTWCVWHFKTTCSNRVYEAVQKYAADAKLVLDLECGKCCNTTKLISNGVVVKSLDVVDKGVCTHPALFDGIHIPFKDGHFDLGICSFALHHTPNQYALLYELKRTCSKVIIIENTPENASDWRLTQKHSQSECKDCFKTSKEWKHIFDILGYKLLASDEISRWTCPFANKPWWYPIKSHVFVLKS